MRPHTLRWRLPLSYAGIALLATLALGGILLALLGAYYQRREADYLRANAAAVGAELAPLLAAGAPPEALQAQVRAYAFLLQSRVRVEDTARGLSIDSGPPTRLSVAIGAVPAADQVGGGTALGPAGQILVRPATTSAAAPIPTPPAPPPAAAPGGVATEQALAEQLQQRGSELEQLDGVQPIARTIYGFNLGPEAAREERRSSAVAAAPIRRPGDGQPIGEVRFSDGPAYGREIVLRVAWSLAFAGLLATAVSAAAGWRLSRHVTRPLAALAGATTRMAAGDLAARVALRRRDEIGQLAQSFDVMAERVDVTVQTLRRFVADAAHELNTPLTALQANLDLAQEMEEPAELRHHVERASAEAERLARLAQSLLQLSRLEGAPQEPPRLAHDLGGLVQELSEGYGAWAEQAGVQFQVELPAGPVVVHGRAPEMRQAVGNVVANAVKFTPAGGRVSVRVEREGGWGVVRVADSGIGIPADELPRLFDRFQRGRNAQVYPGSGLGLAIVKTIMAGHGGEVAAESGAAGSCFTLRWPAESAGGQSSPRRERGISRR